MERYRHDAYGAVIVLEPDGSADADGLSDVENPFTFTGRRLDVESGLMQYRNRCLDVTLGRFISRDPARYIDGYNLYAYASARPSFGRDPSGFSWRLAGWMGPAPGSDFSHIRNHPHMPDIAKDMVQCVLESIMCEVWIQLGRIGSNTVIVDTLMIGATCGQPCGARIDPPARCPPGTCDLWHMTLKGTVSVTMPAGVASAMLWIRADDSCPIEDTGPRESPFLGFALGVGVPISITVTQQDRTVRTDCIEWKDHGGGGTLTMIGVTIIKWSRGLVEVKTPVARLSFSDKSYGLEFGACTAFGVWAVPG